MKGLSTASTVPTRRLLLKTTSKPVVAVLQDDAILIIVLCVQEYILVAKERGVGGVFGRRVIL